MSRLQDGRPAPPGAVRTRGLGRPLPARGRDAREHVLPPRRTLQARPRGPPGRCRPPADPSQGESLGAPRKGEDAKQGRAGRGPGRRRCAGCGPGGRQHRPGHGGAGRPRGQRGLSPVDTEEPRAGARLTLPSPQGGRSGRRGPPCSAPSGRLSPERRSCVGHQGRRAARTGLARETALPPRVHVDGRPLGHGPAGALGASKRLCVRGPCSRHGPLTSRELEGGPGVPATSGARGTLQRCRRADSEQGTGMRTATQAALAVAVARAVARAVAGAVAGGPGHSGVQRDSSHGRRKEPCEGRSDPGSSDPGQGASAMPPRPALCSGEWPARRRRRASRAKDGPAPCRAPGRQGPRGPCGEAAAWADDVQESWPGVLGRPHQEKQTQEARGRGGPRLRPREAGPEARRTCLAHRGVVRHGAACQPGSPFTRKSVLVWTAKCVSTLPAPSQHPRSHGAWRRELEAEGAGGVCLLRF